MKAKLPETLTAAIQYFADEANCHNFLCALRWPSGKPRCGHCDSLNVGNLSVSRRIVPAKMVRGKLKPERVLTRRLWNCKNCRKQFTAVLGTVFEASPLGLDKWFTGVWLLTNCKNGISSYEVAASLGITQKSAWFLMHRVRRILHDGSVDKLAGTVEADESFIGAKARNMHADKKARFQSPSGWIDNKTAVAAVLERGTRKKETKGLFGKSEKTPSRVRAHVVKDTQRGDLQPYILRHVARGSNLMTDEQPAYGGMEATFVHQVVCHAVTYVSGSVHTNGLENFWSLFKRTVKGTYVCPRPFHLWRYLDEQSFRFNERKADCLDRFTLAVSEAPGKRLTWKKLTAKKDDQDITGTSETFSL